MKTNTTKGLTLVEIVIVLVIIGLLAAMAIPAYMKVRDASVVAKARRGETLTESERERYKNAMKRPWVKGAESKQETDPQEKKDPVVPALSLESKAQTPSAAFYFIRSDLPIEKVMIGGKEYLMIPGTYLLGSSPSTSQP